jgi:hypothetical protein
MPPWLYRPLSSAEHERALAKIVRRAALLEYDRSIIQSARQAIQRSRELLDATKHQVIPPSQRGEHGGSLQEPSGHQT